MIKAQGRVSMVTEYGILIVHFIHVFLHSYIHSFIHSIHSYIHTFIHSRILSSIHAFIYFPTFCTILHDFAFIPSQILRDFPEELRGDICIHLYREILALPIFESASPGCLKALSLTVKTIFCGPGGIFF